MLLKVYDEGSEFIGISMFICWSWSLLSGSVIRSKIESISKFPKLTFMSSGERGVSGVIDFGDNPAGKWGIRVKEVF